MGIDKTIFLDDFTSEGIIIEKKFRKKINEIDWKIYKDKKVLMQLLKENWDPNSFAIKNQESQFNKNQ